jgi:hypothetical protein
MSGHRAPEWDEELLDRLVPVFAKYRDVPPDDVYRHLMFQECNFASLYRDLEAAAVLLPRPGYAAKLQRRLAVHEPEARATWSFVKFMPASLPPDEISHMHQAELARKLGKIGLRLLPQIKKWATERHVAFRYGDGVFSRATVVLYSLISDFRMMRDRQGPFGGLCDELYNQWRETLIKDIVLGHDIKLLLIDDVSRPLPVAVKRFVHGYDAIISWDQRFTMRIHAGKMTRSYCERTIAPSPCNVHIDETLRMFGSLHRYVTHDQKKHGLAEYLKKELSRGAA